MSPQDPNSLSNFYEIKTTNLDLNLKVSFEEKKLSGYVTLDMVAVTDTVAEIVLDTSYMNVENVSMVQSGKTTALKFAIDARHEAFGCALRITLPTHLKTGSAVAIRVDYETTEKCTALQWLEPSQTSGKKHPYLFSQCQAIHARSLVPCQDTPAIKLHYTASITTPKPLSALMSALRVGSSESEDGMFRTFKFHQKTSIPTYLIAIAVGNLAEREIGPRSSVWSEPEVVDAAAWEFEDTEKFICIAEELLTPYEWGLFDLLILPPSFPYGGMENPCLTFVTPTLLSGDKSLVDVAAHELAHSWCGNLVTTSNWTHFWLNEGWTVFMERKIVGRMHGEAVRQFSAIIGWKALEESIKTFGAKNPLTALRPNLDGIDPDDSFSSVPYEKGFNLLYHLEQLLGGPSVFEPYMKANFKHFAHQSISTEDWKDFLYTYMQEHHGEEKLALLKKVDWNTWFTSPGMPPVKCDFDRTLAEVCDSLAKRWDAARSQTARDFSPSDIENFTPEQKMVFLERCQEYEPFPHDVLQLMDKVYSMNGAKNSEIRFRWQILCLRGQWEAVFPHVVSFLLEQGRMKFVRPLYRNLHNCPGGSQLAKDTFVKNRRMYHPIAAALIEKDIMGKVKA